tara:strand:- start:1721 stop:1870 length:150 start_codon:yes stop_codon:yes gene_type:complete
MTDELIETSYFTNGLVSGWEESESSLLQETINMQIGIMAKNLKFFKFDI